MTKEFFLGDFNAGVEDTDIEIFCSSYNLSSMVNKVVTVIKISYQKSQPKIIPYRHYKNFSNDIFRDSLQKIFPQNL